MKRTIAFLGLLGVVTMASPALPQGAATDADAPVVVHAVAPTAHIGWAVGQWNPMAGAVFGAAAGFVASKVGWIIGTELGGPLGGLALGAAGAGLGGF